MALDSRLHTLLGLSPVTAVRALAQARHMPVILVGGAVRDALLGDGVPHDLDFAVQGDAVALARATADALGADVYVMDAERGTARVLLPDSTLDFAVCRGATWREDLLARDFTLNAIAIDLAAGDLIDATGGLTDLRQRVIRATSDHAIGDDPVRALRAIRLANALELRITPDTLNLVRAADRDILRPSAERVRDEFMDILNLPRAASATRQLDEVGLLAPIAPEIEPMRDCEQSPPHLFTVLEHTFRVIEALDEEIATCNLQPAISNLQSPIAEGRTRAAVLRLAALLHDCAKPFTQSTGEDGRIHFYEHEAVGADMAAARARALRLSGDEVGLVRRLVRNHMRPNQMAREAHPPTPRALYRFFRDAGDGAPLLALFAIADCAGKRGAATEPDECEPSRRIAALLLDRYYAQFDKSVAPAPLINGKEVLDLGVKQGPRIGQILEAVREAQMAGDINTREQAMALARQLSSEQ